MNKRSRANKYLDIIVIFCICAVVLYSLIGRGFQPDNWGQDNSLQTYSGSWYRIDVPGEKQPVEVPGEVKVTDEKEIVIATILPDSIMKDTYLCFRSGKQDMLFKIDGEQRFLYSNKDNRFTGTHSPVARVFLEIHPEDAGKELTINISTDSSYGGTLYEVLQGSQMAYWASSFETNGAELITALFMLFLSVIIIVVTSLIRLAMKDLDIDLIYLAFGMMVIYTWVTVNSDFRQLLFPNLSIVSDLAFYMVLLIPAPFLVYLNAVQKRRYTRLLSSLKVIVLCDFFICTILHVLQIVDFDQTFKYMAAVDAVSVLLTVGTMLIDLVKGKLKEYKIIAIGFLSIIVCGMVQMGLYIMHILKFGGIVMSLGMSILLVCEVLRTISALEKVQKDKIEAIQAKEARSKFLANMSHELRTPINSVLGLNTMILRECDDTGIRKYARDIQSAGKSLLSIINDILDFSKIEAGKMEIVPVEYDLASMINDIYNMIHPKAEEKGLDFILDVDGNLPGWYFGDDVRIKQVLVNLLTNAVKYTHTGEVIFKITGECANGEAKLLFSVKDTGIGIKEVDLSKLTEEFVRIEESRNRNIEGTGLGINIVTSILQMMGSKLEVESVYGEGSRFFFTLSQPIVKQEAIGDINERMQLIVDSDEYEVSFCIPDCRLLVVDDNNMNRVVFVNLLKEMKCIIDEAESGAQCLEMVAEKKYDIIFMDHMMPEMDGIETYHRMMDDKECINRDTPVIILTANAISGAREMYLEEGFNGYISKPIDADKLEKKIGELIPDSKKQAAPKKEKKSKEDDTENLVEDMPFIDGVDWQFAIQKIKYREILEECIDDFSLMAQSDWKTLKGMYEKLCEEQSKENFEAFRIKVHAMKSTAATIGAIHVAGLAKFSEYAARDYDFETIQRLLPILEKEWLTLKAAIDEAFGKGSQAAVDGDEELPGIDADELVEILDIVRVAVEEVDFDRTDACMEELAEHSYPAEQADLLQELKVAVMNMDGTETVDLIEKWKQLINK